MKQIGKIMALLLTVVMVFTIAGCSGGANSDSPLVGTWTLDATETGKVNGDGDEAMVEAMEAAFANTTITYKFDANGNFTVKNDIDGSVEEGSGTWTATEDTITIKDSTGSMDMPYTLENGILVVEQDGVKLALKK